MSQTCSAVSRLHYVMVVALLCVAASMVAACGSDPARVEDCDGADDDQDSFIDEGCPCTDFDISLPAQADSSELIWIGDGYFVVTQTRGSLMLQRIYDDGRVGPSFATGPAPTAYPLLRSFAWSGSVLAIASVVGETSPSVELALFEPDGRLIGRQILEQSTTSPVIGWNGNRFVVAWKYFGSYGFVVAEVAEDGTVFVLPIQAFGEFSSLDSLAISPSTYLVAAQNTQRPITLVVDRVQRIATAPDVQLQLGAASSGITSAFSVGGFALSRVYFRSDRPQQNLAFFDARGTHKHSAVLAWEAQQAAVTSARDGFLAFAVLRPDPSQPSYDLALTRIDSDGNQLPGALTLTTVVAAGLSASVAVADRRFAVAVAHGDQTPAQNVRLVQHCMR